MIGKQKVRKNGTARRSIKKRLGSPMPRSYSGCGGDDEAMHVFHQFGKPTERCQKCGVMHDTVIAWLDAVVESGNAGPHPYVDRGIWTMREFLIAMKR